MGMDYYEEEKSFAKPKGPFFPPLGIGSGSIIRKAIIDKNTRIGANVQLINKEGVIESMDRIKAGVCIR